jgi:acetamidase/formamidase
MAMRGDHDRVAGEGGYSFHSVRPDAFNYVWDNSIEPVLEVNSGAIVEFTVRDASDEQIRADSTSEDVTKLDFDHVNPVSGPVYVRTAQPGDVLAVEIVEFKPRDWGWTALIPGFGLLANEFREPWLRISRVEVEQGKVVFADGIELPYEPFPGTIGVAPEEPGPHFIVPPLALGRQHGHQASPNRHDPLPAGRRGGGTVLGRGHPLSTGRRRGLWHRHRDCNGRLLALVCPA